MRVVAGRVSEIPAGTCKIVKPSGSGQGIGVFNVRGTFYALKNVCPHQGAELCLGSVTGTSEACAGSAGPPQLKWVRDGEVITCPHHHWEFEIATGRTLFPSRFRVAPYEVTIERRAELGIPPDVETYPVAVEDDFVIVDLSRSRKRGPDGRSS